jgi:two-component system cell cycle sensor histidine kinase PleC
MLWIVAVTGGAAAAVVGMFFWMAWHAREIVVTDTYNLSSNLALSVEQFTARTIETVDLRLRNLGDVVAAKSASGARDVAALLNDELRRAPQLSGLAVIGTDGEVRVRAPATAEAHANVADQAYFQHARDGDGVQVVLAERDPSRGEAKQIVLSRRITRPDGRFAGVLTATLSRDYLQLFFSVLRLGEHGVIALANNEGTILTRRPALESEAPRTAFPELFTEWLPLASSAVVPLRDERDGELRIIGYQRVEKLPLVALVALSKDDALANWRRTTLIQADVCAGIVLALAFLAVLIYRAFHARILAHHQLRETVRELEEARIAAEELSRVKSQFLANMSHELRTPLNAIIGFSEVIRDARMGPVDARYRDYARDIHNSGDHLLRLINDVLDLAKVEAGRLELHEEPLDLCKLFLDCNRLIADRLVAGRLEFASTLPGAPPQVVGDELRLKQILLNLLSNAIKFTPPGGRIRLSAAVIAEGLAIAVADTGIGMEPNEIAIALEPFRQVDGAFARRFEGTGLGLPLAERLAELHGGRLAITSTKGSGTVATLYLPARRVLAPDSENTAAAAE